MIDFPASPADGQVFSATNGVVYKYSLANTAWLAQNAAPPLGGTGDFCATSSATITLATSFATLKPDTIRTGNAGLWYSVSTGRYTPPAGRFFLAATVSANNASAAFGLLLQLTKNGAQIAYTPNSTTSVGPWITNSIEATVDANGSDYFELQASSTAASSVTSVANTVQFSAFPLTGMQGPTGGAPGPVVGDFLATMSGVSVGTAIVTPVPMTVQSGNSGGYFVPATGRWTPPAGRYFIWTGMTCAPTGASNCYCFIRKNGTAFISGNTTVTTAGFWGEPTAQYTVDANGTDWFDCQMQSANFATAANSTIWFGAYPTQGMVGPQGPQGIPGPGALALYSETVLAAANLEMRVTIPANAKAIEIWFAAHNTGAANEANGLCFQALNGSTVIATNSHSYQNLYSTGTTVGGTTGNSTLWNLGAGQAHLFGVIRGNVAGLVSGYYAAEMNADYTGVTAGGTPIKIQLSMYGSSAPITGFRLANGSGTLTFAAGSYMRVFAVV